MTTRTGPTMDRDVQVDEVAEHLHRVVLPLPYDPRTVNAYVEIAPGDDRVLLVDAGTDHPRCLEALLHALERLGVEPARVADVVVTHAHVDHYGLAGWFEREHRSRVWMHRAETLILERHWRPDWWVPVYADYLRRNGVEAGLAGRLAALEDWTATLTPFTGFYPLEDGQVLAGPVRRWQVIHTPGHSAGHIALWHAASATLLGGDHILELYSPHLRDVPGELGDPLAAYLSSLDRLAALKPRLTLPGHGDPIGDTPAAAEYLRRGHEEVLDRVRALALRPVNAGEVSRVLHGEKLPDFHLRLALPQTMVYLRHLELRGELRQHLDGGVSHFQLAAGPGGTADASHFVRLDEAF